MAIKISIKSDLKGIKVKTDRMVKTAQYALANQVHADSNIYAPKKVGDLRSQSSVAMDGKSIIWNVPYARYQYYGMGFKYTTPGTGPKWDQKAKSIHMASWINVTKAAMR